MSDDGDNASQPGLTDIPPTTVSVTFSVHVPSSAPTAKRKNAANKLKKEAKKKELTYTFTNDTPCYARFMKRILMEYKMEKYNKVEKVPFRFCMSTKKPKNSAIDIESVDEYVKFIENNIVIEDDERAQRAYLWVDIDHVVDAHSKASRRLSDDDEEDDDDDDFNQDGISLEDRKLADAKIALIKQWGNDHDQTLHYIDPLTGASHPLSLTAQNIWARAIVSADASKLVPPRGLTFDPDLRLSSIPAHRRINNDRHEPPQSGQSDLAQVNVFFSNLTNLLRPPTPSSSSSIAPSSPPIYSPGKLQSFLQYASTHGIPRAPSYRTALAAEDYGPDILPTVDNALLTNLGMSDGEARRLKEAARTWWAKPDAKRKSVEVVDLGGPTEEPPLKRISLEKRFESGGGSRTVGVGFADGDVEVEDHDPFVWWYQCEVTNRWVRVPEGLVPILEGEGDDFDAE